MLAWLGGKRRLLDISGQHANKRCRPGQAATHQPATGSLSFVYNNDDDDDDDVAPLTSQHHRDRCNQYSHASDMQPSQSTILCDNQGAMPCTTQAQHAPGTMSFDMLMVAGCDANMNATLQVEEKKMILPCSDVAGSAMLEVNPQPAMAADSRWPSARNAPADTNADQHPQAFAKQTPIGRSVIKHKVHKLPKIVRRHAAAIASAVMMEANTQISNCTKKYLHGSDLGDVSCAFQTPTQQQRHATRDCRNGPSPCMKDLILSELTQPDFSGANADHHDAAGIEAHTHDHLGRTATSSALQDSLQTKQQQHNPRPSSLDLLFLGTP